jgi:predicted acylesterase/phospholipase RssA
MTLNRLDEQVKRTDEDSLMSTPEQEHPSPEIAVALSGGGHRACVFALGALLYLHEAKLGSRVTSIASVSGGSLANAVVGTRVDFQNPDDDVEGVVGAVSKRISALPWALKRRGRFGWLVAALALAVAVGWWWLPASLPVRIGALIVGLVVVAWLAHHGVTGGGTLFGWLGTWAYLLALVLLVEAVVVVVTQLFDWSLAGKLGAIAGSVLIVSWLASKRGLVAGWAFARTLFDDGWSTRLEALEQKLDHVICATDLHAGHNVYFSPKFVYGYGFGFGEPGGLRLHVATQASAAFPGAFPVRSVEQSRFKFEDPDERYSRLSSLKLVDGGVYDNMGDQWAQGLEDRARPYPEDTFKPANQLVVVSASAGLGFTSLKRLGWPVVGELLTLMRDKGVLYDNGNSVRRRELVARFDLAERDNDGLAGALVHIVQSPHDVPNAFQEEHNASRWPDRAERGKAALAALDGGPFDEAAWEQIAKDNAAVATTLVAFDKKVTAQLLHHAYVLTMVNLHVILGYPLLLPMPSAGRFQELAS